MNKLMKTTLIAAAIVVPTWAMAAMNTGDMAGKTEAEIRASVEAAGYAVKKIEAEDGEFEVYAELDGQLYELEVSADTGQITEIELEDDEDDGDDD